MNHIYAHIVGLDDDSKDILIDFIKNNKKFIIYDLDQFTKNIIQDKNMNYLYEKYEFCNEKLNDNNTSKIQHKQLQNKLKLLERKMNVYWKSRIDSAINNMINNSTKYIILIGYSTFFKNHKIGVSIKSNLKFFYKVDLNNHCKKLIEYNLNKYKNDIINGLFPLDYLNLNFLKKKRETLLTQYTKSGYTLDTINNIINTLHISLDIVMPNHLFFASTTDFNKKIDLNKIVAYTDEWVALASVLNCEKGYNNKKPYITIDNIDRLNKSINLYIITNTNDFKPIFSHGIIYKYQTNSPVVFSNKKHIDNLLTKFKILNIKIDVN